MEQPKVEFPKTMDSELSDTFWVPPFLYSQLHKMAKKGRQSTGSQSGKAVAAAPSPAATPKTKAKQAAAPKSATPLSKKAAKAPTPEPEVAEEDEEDWEDEDSEDEDDEDDGVTEEGMQRLMALLEKEDALDDFDMAQLGEGSDDEEESEDGEEDEDEEDEDEEDAEMDAETNGDETSAKPTKRVRISTEEEVQEATEGDLALDDLESDLSVDEDAIPQRKVTKNNKVRDRLRGMRGPTLTWYHTGRSRGTARGYHGDKYAVRRALDAHVIRGPLGSGPQ